LERNWFAAQIARFTGSGASAGAQAKPARRRAVLPGTVGPLAGKDAAAADETIAAEIAALKNVLDETMGITRISLAVPMPKIRFGLEAKKFWRQQFGKICSHAPVSRRKDGNGPKGGGYNGLIWRTRRISW
jgi:hypothetical protein